MKNEKPDSANDIDFHIFSQGFIMKEESICQRWI